MAVEIINSHKNITFDCIDTWKGSSGESVHQNNIYIKTNTLYELFLSNIDPVKHVINPIRKTSEEASYLYDKESVDIIFIDACHDYECVIDDIKLWLPKIKNNGILAGHDYNHLFPGVIKAVNELLGPDNIIIKKSSWVYCKNKLCHQNI